MPRLFVALDVPPSIAAHVSFLQGGLFGARWIDKENFHITLRFIGDIERPMARELAAQLERVKTEPFMLELAGLDVFGNAKPHSLFAGVERNASLYELQAAIERICQRVGLPPDPRKFTPHLTLARVRGLKPQAIANYLSGNGLFRTAPFSVDHFTLYSSRNSVGGGPYLAEETYRLVTRESVHA
ncbi:MAG: RNA 2',3'-cyclic phosphodiesterase [Rhizobiaceae bacterium]|jgi:2'-5' RNA ligase|nr:RNA 2',3'-cyclic phosphodiesterase [Rhizobiaceae bacterium]